MKKYISIAAAAFLCASCVFNVNPNFQFGNGSYIKGEGPIITKTLDFSDFNGIRVNGNAVVNLTQGEEWEVLLTTHENIFDTLDYKVEDSILVIQIKDKQRIKAEKYELAIQMPELAAFEVNGAADGKVKAFSQPTKDVNIRVNGAGDLEFEGITCKQMSVKVNGAADFEGSGLDVESVDVEVNGAGDVELKGKAGNASFEVHGAGDIDARELSVAGEVKKKTAGAARIRL